MSGDRHLRPDPEGRLAGSPPRLSTVLITADTAHVATIAGQHLLQMLVNLLARQFGVVRTIVLDLPPQPAQAQVFRAPAISAGDLTDALLALGARVGSADPPIGAIAAADESSGHDVHLHVGGGFDPTRARPPALAVAADGWEATARTSGPLAAEPPRSTNPLGPHLAACVAAGFAFKAAFGKNPTVDTTLNLWPHGPAQALDGLHLPAAYVLGLGAVGAAFGYTLSCIEGAHGTLVGVDPQLMSDTDRNRLISAAADDVGTPKTALFASSFAGTQFEVSTFSGRWPREYLADPDRDIPAGLRVEENAGRYRWVISCVDRDPDRFDIASRLPRHVLSGSTYGMAALVIYYSTEGPCECLGCRHRQQPQFTVEDGVTQLRSLDEAGRAAWYERHGASPDDRDGIETYLRAQDPTCASPGAADLTRLGLQGEVDWAVGFVSVAAGVLLAARFVRAAMIGTAEEIEAGSEWRLFFWRDVIEPHRAQRNADCPLCNQERAPAWRALWHSKVAGEDRT